jgi:hypothetical protein
VKVNDDDPGGITIPTWYGDDTISETDNGSKYSFKIFRRIFHHILMMLLWFLILDMRMHLDLKNSKVVSPEILEPVLG